MAYAKDYFNCINKPLIGDDPQTTILDIIPPPELHLMLGATNHIFDALNENWGGNQAYNWGLKHNITRVDYHGGSLDGNNCKRLLEKAELLKEELPDYLKAFAEALVAFNNVRKHALVKN